MEMQRVELPRSHQVEDLKHLVDSAEVACHVEHEAAVLIIWPVF